VPTDIELDGNEGTFNIQVLFDSKELYGRLTATQQVVIYRD